ncbi:MAG TPA: phosphatase PAP2 family protein [Candidatus Polarisedimenticolia bacterium]
MKPVRALVLMTILMAPLDPRGAGAEEETPPASPADSSGSSSEKGYFRRHLLHWVTAFGTSYADTQYEDQVGVSTHPLLFSDPPWIDRWVRQGLSSGPTKSFLLEHRARIGAALSLGAAILSNLGRERSGRFIADDTTGFVEVWFFDKGASGLVKNIVGRQRPEIEFIDERDDLTAAEKEEEEAKRTNHQSFYSGSTSRQFALMSYADAIVAGRVRSRGARVASFLGFYCYAAYVGYSRLEEDEHYLTDVVAGAAAGILIGRGFYKAHHRPERPERRVTLRSVAPIPGGASVLFSVRL